MNGRRFRLLPGASTREPPRFLLCAACARQQAGQLVKGARESAFESSAHAAGQVPSRSDLVTGRCVCKTAGPGVG